MGIQFYDRHHPKKAPTINLMKKSTTTTIRKGNKREATSRKRGKKQLILATIAVGATGVLGYFGWQYYKKHRSSKRDSGDIDAIINNLDQPIVALPNLPKQRTTINPVTRPAVSIPDRDDAFPLKKGSKGENVRLLQEALITKYGKQVLPKWGADGDFGSELEAALNKLGLPATIDESTLNVIAQGTTTNPTAVGKDLYNAAAAKDYSKTINLLKKLKTVEDYSAASNVFKQERINGVRQTLVNGLLNTFASESQKQAIKLQFLRMGLQFDGNKWTLSGFDGRPIVTRISTSVWLNATDSVPVPAQMVLGNEVTRRLDYTLFENGGKHFLVQTKSVQYL